MELIATTKRLRIRKFSPADAVFMLELVNTPSWLRYIGDRNIYTIEAAENYLRNGPIRSYNVNGFGGFCLEEAATGRLIGSCGFYRRDGLELPDLGFALLPEFEGKGFAFEAAEKLIGLFKKDHTIPVICAITAQDNERSVRLLHRLGFSRVKLVRLPGDHEELSLFTMQLR